MPVINKKKENSELFDLLIESLPPLKNMLYEAFVKMYYEECFPFIKVSISKNSKIRKWGEYPVCDEDIK